MKYEFFIAQRLQLYVNDHASKSSVLALNIAITGIILAIVIMIASISVVSGFKRTIVDKVSALEAHIKIVSGKAIVGENDPIQWNAHFAELAHSNNIESVCMVAESPCVIKTASDFNGLILRGVTYDYDLSFLKNHLISGRMDMEGNNIVISQYVANRLQLQINDRISVYFINNGSIKVRKLCVEGIFNTDFEDFDKNYIVGNIGVVQSVNAWKGNSGTAIEIKCGNLNDIDRSYHFLVDDLYQMLYRTQSDATFQVSTIYENNSTYFAWLELLDTNIIVILILMTCVACFSLIAGLLIVVLNRIHMIGVLKSMGANNKSIRYIFICLIQKMIFKSMFWGNIIGFTLILAQKYLHVIKLNPETYYMDFVPVDINFWLLVLNIAILIVSILSLIGPSCIVTSIKPAKTIRFE